MTYLFKLVVCVPIFFTIYLILYSVCCVILVFLTCISQGYKPPEDGPSEYQTIPLHKIEDFGVHCNQYYALDVSYFKSSLDKKLLDCLWNKYWVNTLSSSSLLTVSPVILITMKC